MNRTKMCLLLLSSSVFLGGCGSDSESGAKVNLSMSLVNALTGSSQVTKAMSDFKLDSLDPILSPFTVFKGVYAIDEGLESLKLFIQGISICKEVEMNGSAISTSSGCKILYAKDTPDALVNTDDVAAALAAAEDITEGYIDVMDATSREKLNQEVVLTADDVGEYSYVTLSWAIPVKVTATLVDPTDNTTSVLYTKAAAPGSCTVNSGDPYDCAVSTTALSVGPAEEAIFSSPLATSFKFQTPLTISDEDVVNETAYSLTLAFNPQGIIQGVTGDASAGGATNYPPLTDNIAAVGSAGYNLGNTISIVAPQIAPVFFKSDTTVTRETYTTVLSSGSGDYLLRVELYSLSDDEDRAIYGVSAATIPNADTTSYLIGWKFIYGVTTNADGTVDLSDFDGTAQLSSLARITTVGGTTTGSLLCDTVTMSGCSTGQQVSHTFTLTNLEEMD